jgi:F-type H+-transporting ATPase subunit delta
MPRVASGKRYAQAVLELAVERDELESWRVSLRKVAELGGDEKLVALLESPKLPFDIKKGLLEERLGELNPLALNLACLLISRRRFRLVDNISQEYHRLLDAHHGIEHAEVITALPIDDEDKQRLSRQLGEIMGRKIVVDAQVDPSIVGGLVARIGDTLIDGSIRNRLEALSKNLIEAGG